MIATADLPPAITWDNYLRHYPKAKGLSEFRFFIRVQDAAETEVVLKLGSVWLPWPVFDSYYVADSFGDAFPSHKFWVEGW